MSLFKPYIHKPTPRYSGNIANVGLKHQSINQSINHNHQYSCNKPTLFLFWPMNYLVLLKFDIHLIVYFYL